MANGSGDQSKGINAKEIGIEDNFLTSWRLKPDYSPDNTLFSEIQGDLRGKTSILELFSHYMEELRMNPDNNAMQLKKMDKLFEMGITPDRMEGHYYGVPLCFRTGDYINEPLSSINTVLEVLWGATLDGQSPWVGKTFTRVSRGTIDSIIASSKENGENLLGVNHFNKVDFKIPNAVSFRVLNILMQLEPAPPEEKKNYGYERNGGNFIARIEDSVYTNTPRKVYQLNYRWKNLRNIFPLCWLVDEMVIIGEGLYLGQLLFATGELFDQYDPEKPVSDSKYRHFGYFILFDDRWSREARRVFTFLEVPENAPGIVSASVEGFIGLEKFSTFTFEKDMSSSWDNKIFDDILLDMKMQPSILHLLKDYSDKLQGDVDNLSPIFSKLQEIFIRGLRAGDMEGYYRGALVSWHSEGIFKLFDMNMLNVVWSGLAMKFSTWTGKYFEAMDVERIREMTDGYEKGGIPTRWGANTQSTKTFKEKFVDNLSDIANLWNEPVSREESIKNGYDVKNFFFIAHPASSVNQFCKGKAIYQFNYRWPKLRTIVPDCFCLDEVVRIANGLYLGQLLYATKVFLPYDPARESDDYEYRNFGFFLLMDEEWHQIRLKIGFDLSNT